MTLKIIFTISTLISTACLVPNDAYLDDMENISIRDSIPDTDLTDTEIENPRSKSEGLDFRLRLECPEPRESISNIILIKNDDTYGINYAVEWDKSKRAQRWSAMQMYHGNSVQNVRRSGDDAWHEDTDLDSASRTSYADHYQNGYDRGHIIASADRLESRSMNKQTFCYSNIHPQLNVLNAGIWQDMEDKLRSWNNDDFRDTLYVAKGGTIDHDDQILGYTKSCLIVPKYFWMAVLCLKDGKYKAMAFCIEHRNKYNPDERKLANHAVPVGKLESFTGINFFYNLPDEIQEQVKSELNLKDWKL